MQNVPIRTPEGQMIRDAFTTIVDFETFTRPFTREDADILLVKYREGLNILGEGVTTVWTSRTPEEIYADVNRVFAELGGSFDQPAAFDMPLSMLDALEPKPPRVAPAPVPLRENRAARRARNAKARRNV